MADVPDLESQLAGLREAATQRFPALVELNQRMFAELESTVIAKAVDVGDRAPDFELADAKDGTTVKLSAVLEEGPAVLSFYRGHW